MDADQLPDQGGRPPRNVWTDLYDQDIERLTDERDRLRAEVEALRSGLDTGREMYETLGAKNDALRQALDEIVDDLSVPSRPAPWAAHALQVAQMALASDEQEATR